MFRFPVFDFTTGYIKSAGLVKIDNGKVETEPIKSHISKLSEATQSRILQGKPRVMVLMYLPLSIPGLEHPYKYVILMSGTELEEYAAQLRDLKRAMNAPEDVIREQLYNTVVSLILKMCGDSHTKKQIDNTGLELDRLCGCTKKLVLSVDLKGISIKDILDKKKLSSDELNKWAANLSAKEEKLARITRQKGNHTYSFTVEDNVYYWLNLEDLTWFSL
ncbi:MAG TPA: hypothetical protein PLC27_02395 [Saprospiraceae bacterium]|nr:hypothetical protein [Saprospiraceae bacterium]HRG40217.1 hypothetical protein [Saprospiraceae bacterium]